MEAKKREPIQIIEEAIKRKKKELKQNNEYDYIWTVFDHDNRPKLLDAYLQAIKNNIKIAFSSIAFEYWYLLHFKKMAKAFPICKALEKELQKHYPDYKKAAQNDYVLLKNKLETAFENTVWLKKQMQHNIKEGKHITELNPYTDVDDLVKFLFSFSIK